MKQLILMSFATTLLFIVACTNNTETYPATENETIIESTTQEEAPPQETQAQSSQTTYTFPFSFSTEDLHGNQVNEYSVGDKEIFFVYYWTTWCPACVNSMPGLSELADEFGDRVGFISLLGDFDTNRDTAIRIVEGSNIPFLTVNSMDEDFGELVNLILPRALPTSVILDGNGNIIGEHIVGGGTDRFRTALNNALQ